MRAAHDTQGGQLTQPLLAPPPPIYGAATFGTDSYADLGYPVRHLKAFNEASISFRAMFQYPNGYYNNVIGQSGSPYFVIGKDNNTSYLNFAVGGANGAHLGKTHMQDTPAGKVPKEQWVDIVLIIRQIPETTTRWVEFYINNQRVDDCSEWESRCLFDESQFGGGTLRLGMQGASWGEQFYGLIDNVAIWHKALNSDERQTLVNYLSYPDSTNPALMASWTFDRWDGPAYYSTPTFVGRAYIAGISGTGESWADREALAPPSHATVYEVPMEGTLCVVNPVDSPPEWHHSGYASFSLDLVNLNGLDPSACGGTQDVSGRSQGTRLFAPADGYVVYVYNGSPDNCNHNGCWPRETVPGCTPCADGSGENGECLYPANELILYHRDGEYTEYLHLENDSIPEDIREAYADGEEYFVTRGQYIGNVGSSGSGGDHLHFSHYWNVEITPPGPFELNECGYHMEGGPRDVITRPFAFSNYWSWNGSGYGHVPRGTAQYLEVFTYSP